MSPTYHNGQFVIINKHDRDFEVGDVIAFWNPSHNFLLIKRITGSEGDEVMVGDKRVVLKENEYYVLGDNKKASTDSRDTQIGIVKENQMIGIVMPSTKKEKRN